MRAFLACLLLFAEIFPAGAAEAASCAGRDLIAELRTTDPAAYAAAQEKLKATPNGEGLLWKIEGAAKPSYLFGTIHLSDPRVVQLAPDVKKAFEDSEKLAVEIDTISPEETGALMLRHAMVQAGGTLDDLPVDVKPGVEAALAARGIPTDAAGHFEQWFLVVALALPPCAFHDMAGHKPEEVLDGSLVKAARDAGKPVIALETAEEQIKIFKTLDRDLIRRGLVLVPRFEPMVEDVFETMTQAYIDRRVALMEHALPAIAGLNAQETADAADFQRALIDGRNVTMVETSSAELHKGGLFIAVGAGHLPGEKGLVELIRKAGFEVTRVW
jgi:uncharacterized protein YbaP (TraB family)